MAGRTEARIFTSIWRDGAYISLSVDAQWLYEFLISQDDLAYCGVLPLRPARWRSKAAGMTVGRIEAALKELEGTAYPTANPDPESAHTSFVIADPDTGELLIRSLIRRDGIWKQPNLLKLAIESAEQVESLRIRGALLSELKRLPLEETGSAQVKTLVADFIAMLEKGGPYPTAYPPPYPSDHPPDEGSDDPTPKDYACAGGSGGEVTSEQDLPDPLFPAAPRSSMPAQARKRATRLPEDFTLTAEMLTWAAEHAPHVNASREFDRFGDHWRGKAGRDGTKLDWLATWRNWMRTAQDRQGPRDRPAARGSTTDQRVADAQALKAQFREQAPPDTIPGSVVT